MIVANSVTAVVVAHNYRRRTSWHTRGAHSLCRDGPPCPCGRSGVASPPLTGGNGPRPAGSAAHRFQGHRSLVAADGVARPTSRLSRDYAFSARHTRCWCLPSCWSWRPGPATSLYLLVTGIGYGPPCAGARPRAPGAGRHRRPRHDTSAACAARWCRWSRRFPRTSCCRSRRPRRRARCWTACSPRPPSRAAGGRRSKRIVATPRAPKHNWRRIAAMRVLAAASSPGSLVSLLRRALDDPDPEIVGASLAVLGRIPDMARGVGAGRRAEAAQVRALADRHLSRSVPAADRRPASARCSHHPDAQRALLGRDAAVAARERGPAAPSSCSSRRIRRRSSARRRSPRCRARSTATPAGRRARAARRPGLVRPRARRARAGRRRRRRGGGGDRAAAGRSRVVGAAGRERVAAADGRGDLVGARAVPGSRGRVRAQRRRRGAAEHRRPRQPDRDGGRDVAAEREQGRDAAEDCRRRRHAHDRGAARARGRPGAAPRPRSCWPASASSRRECAREPDVARSRGSPQARC